MNNNENWMKVADYETYSVSDKGNVRNDKTGRILQPGTSTGRYLFVSLRKKNHYPKQCIVWYLGGFYQIQREKMRRSH